MLKHHKHSESQKSPFVNLSRNTELNCSEFSVRPTCTAPFLLDWCWNQCFSQNEHKSTSAATEAAVLRSQFKIKCAIIVTAVLVGRKGEFQGAQHVSYVGMKRFNDKPRWSVTVNPAQHQPKPAAASQTQAFVWLTNSLDTDALSVKTLHVVLLL